MIAIIVVEDKDRIIHPICVEYDPARPRHEAQQTRQIQSAYPVEPRLEDKDDKIERHQLVCERQFRQPRITNSVDRKSMAAFPTGPGVLCESLYAAGIDPALHRKENPHAAASSPNRFRARPARPVRSAASYT